MTSKGKTRLELTWIGKDERPRLEPRILIEDQSKSYHAGAKREGDIFDNMLIHGDNLLALKALEADYAGKIKCVYIDPPYNTGSAFGVFYDDGVEHSVWLSLIRDRIEIIYNLISTDGSIFVSIDDREMPYLRVLLDEIFGRYNFVASAVWQKRYSRENRGAIGDAHEYVVIYAKNADIFKSVSNKIPIDEKSAAVYKNTTNDPKGRWRGIPMTAQGYRPNQMYKITTPSGAVHTPPEGRCWSTTEDKFLALVAAGKVYFGKNNDSQPALIRYLSEVDGITPWTWWPHDECGHTDEAKKEMHSIFGRDEAFDTPKPERLIKRILDIATNPGDLVLDSFAGSGTTGAVAQKMGRRWIMVELGDHAVTHIVPRMNKVIDGEEKGGVTETTSWHGGGGYRFYNLAPSLLEADKWGRWVISKEYNAAMLAEAMCRHMGFTYAPAQDTAEYWRHGYSSERDFIYVTTLSLTHDQLRAISDDVGPDRTLLICCKAFNARVEDFENITIQKIPHAILSRCEWGKDDYSLKIAALPELYDAEEPDPEPARKEKGAGRKAAVAQSTLFGSEEE